MPSSFCRMADFDLPLEDIATCGWGHLIERLHVELERAGFQLLDRPEGADIEFCVGQPGMKLKPEMHPCVTLSMYETTQPPQYWIDSFNRWDAVINPSTWGVECFKKHGVEVPIHPIPLGIDAERFKFQEREVGEHWIYLAQAVQLLDRKEINRVLDIFFHNKMPADAHLILKTVPKATASQEVFMPLHPQIEWMQLNLSWEKLLNLYSECHASVNPSAGEGFGFLVGEHMLSGMCVALSDASGFREMVNSEVNLPMPAEERITPHYKSGRDYLVEEEDILKAMLFSYENREEALEIGRRASTWVQQTFTFSRMVESLIEVFESLVSVVPKSVSAWSEEEDLNDWINLYDVFGGKAWNTQLLSPRIAAAMRSANLLDRFMTAPRESTIPPEYSL